MILAFGLFQNSQGCRIQGPQLLPQPPPVYVDTPTHALTCTHSHTGLAGVTGVGYLPACKAGRVLAEEKRSEPPRSGPCGSRTVLATGPWGRGHRPVWGRLGNAQRGAWHTAGVQQQGCAM